MCSVIGEKSLSTYLELDSFDIESVERYLYMGCKVVTPFARVIKKSTWFATAIIKHCHCFDKCKPEEGHWYDLTPDRESGLDFLLYSWFRWKTPQINLVNLPQRVPVTNGNGENLFYAVVTTSITLPSGVTIPGTVQNPVAVVATREVLEGAPFSFGPAALIPILSDVPEQRVRWTENLMHNIFQCIQFVVNGIPLEEFDRVWLDQSSEFRLPGDKYVAYQKMIGNIPELIQPTNSNIVLPDQVNITQAFIPSVELKLPIPFSYARAFMIQRGDSGNGSTALPLLNLFCNTIQVVAKLVCDLKDLLIFERQVTEVATTLPSPPPGGLPFNNVYTIVSNDGDLVADQIQVTQLGVLRALPGQFRRICRHPPTCGTNDIGINYGEFIDINFCVDAPVLYSKVATVTEDERCRHRNSCVLRSILAETVISLTHENICPGSTVDVPLNKIGGQTRAVFFNVANQTARTCGQWSNYSNNSNEPQEGQDTVKSAGIIYNKTETKVVMPADHFSEIEPFYHDQRVPDKIGYHTFNWDLWINSLDPDGSVGLDEIKLAILRIITNPSGFDINHVPVAPCHCDVVTLGEANTHQYAVELRALGWQVYNILNDDFSFC